MKIFNVIILSLLIIMAVIGLIFLILLFFGFRPILDTTVEPDWEAISSIGTIVSSIGTILAVIVALFIIKWQDKINNQKNITISWLYVEKQDKYRLAFPNITDRSKIDEICIRFMNTGNRRVVLDIVYIELFNKVVLHFPPDRLAPKGTQPEMLFPYVLEP